MTAEKPVLKKELENSTFNMILNSIHEGVCIVDREGTVLLWNKGAELLFNLSAGEIVARPLADFFPNALLLDVIRTQKAAENVLHSPREGTYVIVSARPLYHDGHFVGAVSTDKEVTEMMNMASELEETRGRLELLQEEVSKLSEDKYSFGNILGRSRIIKDRIARAEQVARISASVLIEGESGTGKEIFARAIHQASGRKGPFVAVNCSAIPENLFESEMFGYVAGAFTGALKKGKAGKFELAHCGTLFLDEIGDMPAQMQAKLLRVLQEGKVNRVGAEKALDTDVRIISASNRDLEELVDKRQFREDLFYRLNVVKIHLPSLRERKEDIPLLIELFIKEFCRENNLTIPKLSPEVFGVLMDYDWKGNVRELKNTVQHLVVFSKNGNIDLNSVPEHVLEGSLHPHPPDSYSFNLEKCVTRTETEVIGNAMKLAKGNKSRAAKLLNVPRSTLYYKLDYYGMKNRQ